MVANLNNATRKDSRGSGGETAAFDKDAVKRIEDIEKLDADTKKHLFFLIDNVIQNFKTKKAFS